MSRRVDKLASTLKDTNKNLKAVDRMLEEYRGLGDQQGANMDRLRNDLARTTDKLKEERVKRSFRDSSRGRHPDHEEDWARERYGATHGSTSPLREHGQATDDLGASYRGRNSRRGSVRFYDDMDTDEHLHVLHRSLRDLNSSQNRLEREFNRELTARDKEDYELRKSLQDLSEGASKNVQLETAISTVDKRLQSIQDELKQERQSYRKKQDEVTRLSTDLQSALQQPAPQHPTAEDIELRTRLLRAETQRNHDLLTRPSQGDHTDSTHRLQVEADLEKLNQRLDKAEGGRDALLAQIEDYRRQLSIADQDRQKLAMLLEQQDEEMKNKHKSTIIEEQNHASLTAENRRMTDELRDLRSHLSKSAAVIGDYGGLQQELERSEKQRTQLSDHIQVLNKDLDFREKQAAKMVTQLQDTMDKYEAMEQSRHSTLVQLEDALKKLQATTQEAEQLQTDLHSTQTQLTDSEAKREDIKIRAQETVRQWKLKCKRLEREVDRFTHSTQQMSERNEQLIRDMENIKSQMNVNNQHVEHARQEISDSLAIRAQQEEQVRAKTVEVNELKALKTDYENEIKDQKALIEKFESESKLSNEKYSRLFDEKVSVEDQLYSTQQQVVMLQTQIHQLQKEMKEYSVERVEMAAKLADAAAERQSYKSSLLDSQKRETEQKAEIEGLMLRLKEEKEFYHSRSDAMKAEMEQAKIKESQVLRDLTHRFKKEHAEYEAELQAMKIELHEHRANAKQNRKHQEKHKEELEKLHHDLVISKEETAEVQKKYHKIREEYYSKSQLGEDELNRVRELNMELLNMREDNRKLENDYQKLLSSVSTEVDNIIELASDHSAHAYKIRSKTNIPPIDPQKWILEVKTKLSWLRTELLERQNVAEKLKSLTQQQLHGSHTSLTADHHAGVDSSADRELYVSDLAKVTHPQRVRSGVGNIKKELEKKDLETSQKVEHLQEQVGRLVAERDTQFAPTTSTVDTHQLHKHADLQSERERINERYLRLQETVNSLKKELGDSTSTTTAHSAHHVVVDSGSGIVAGGGDVNANCNNSNCTTPTRSPSRKSPSLQRKRVHYEDLDYLPGSSKHTDDEDIGDGTSLSRHTDHISRSSRHSNHKSRSSRHSDHISRSSRHQDDDSSRSPSRNAHTRSPSWSPTRSCRYPRDLSRSPINIQPSMGNRKTPPPLAMSDEEFVNRFMLQT